MNDRPTAHDPAGDSPDARLDLQLAALRDSLQADARRSSNTAPALADVKAGPALVTATPRRRRTWVAAALVTAAAAAVVGVVVLTRDDRADTTVPATEPSATPPIDTTAPDTTIPDTTILDTTIPDPSVTGTTFVPHTLVPVTDVEFVHSISYGTVTDGWAVASIGGTNQLIRTVPSGWVLADSPVTGVSLVSVRFADARNGWVIGTNRWWSTHDGGASWNELPLTFTGGSSPELVIADGWVMTLHYEQDSTQAYVVRVWRSPVGRDDFQPTDAVWTKGAGGNDVMLTAASDGTDVLLAENDRGGNTLRLHADGTVAPWNTPAQGRGGDITVSSPPTGGPVWVQSQTGVWGGDTTSQQVLAVAASGGQPFVDVTPPEPIVLDDVGARLCGLSPLDTTTAIAVMCDAQGARQYRTTDLGVTWEQVAEVTANDGTEWSWSSSASPSGVTTLSVDDTRPDGSTTNEVWMIPDADTPWIRVLG